LDSNAKVEDAKLIPLDTIGEVVLREHALRVARAERGWRAEGAARPARRVRTPAAAERRAPRPDPLGVGLVKLIDALGDAVARLTGRLAAMRAGSRSQNHEPSTREVVWVTVPAEDER
jgi:hypothetical protein